MFLVERDAPAVGVAAGVEDVATLALPPKSRHVTRWIMTDPDKITPECRNNLDQILARSPVTTRLTDQVRTFADMMTHLHGHLLPQWIERAQADEFPALRSFANGLQRDIVAVTNGLTLPYSSGAVEGTVTKIKMLKRQMYGRAKFDLLRCRILANE